MELPTLESEQAEALLDELAEALEELMDRSCLDMGPIWLEATREQRAYLGEHSQPELGFEPSKRYLSLGKSSRSKYRGLAAWRHAVLWRGAAEAVEDPDFRAAMECVYFTPYPKNAPPYAWSQRASAAPGVERFEDANTLKKYAKEGCFQSLQALLAEQRALEAESSWYHELLVLLLRPATRPTLWEVLKLDEHSPEEAL